MSTLLSPTSQQPQPAHTSSYVAAWYDKQSDKVVVLERDFAEGKTLTQKSYKAPYYFFVEDDTGTYKAASGEKLRKVSLASKDQHNEAVLSYKRQGKKVFEIDFTPLQRILIDRYYNRPAAKANIAFFDIELDVNIREKFPTVENCYAPLNAVSVVQRWTGKTYIVAVPPKGWKGSMKTIEDTIANLKKVDPETKEAMLSKSFTPIIELVKNELQLLKRMVELFRDADIICGFNSAIFDVPMIVERMRKLGGTDFIQELEYPWCGVQPRLRMRIIYGSERPTFHFAGKAFLDYLEIIDKNKKTILSENKKLGTILANENIQKKLEMKGANFEEFYNNHFEHFVAYNGIDSWALSGLDDKLKLLSLVMKRAANSVSLYPAMTGTVSAIDSAFCADAFHVQGVRVMNKIPVEDKADVVVEGAIVLEPKLGRHVGTASVDMTSLYPKTAITLGASPEKIVGQFVKYEEDWRKVIEESEDMCVFKFEKTGEELELSGKAFKGMFVSHKWALSAYGTAFDQSNGKGIVPSVLSKWFAERKALKDKLGVAEKAMVKFKKDNALELDTSLYNALKEFEQA